MTDDTLPNAEVVSVVQFAPDPRGLGLFSAITGRIRRDLLQQRAVIDARGSGNYGGYAATPQQFTGLAGLVAGRQRVQASRVSQLTSERSTDNAGAMGIFYDQLQRRQT
jgi:hypothetical protein